MDVKDMTGWPITSNLRCSKIYGRKESISGGNGEED